MAKALLVLLSVSALAWFFGWWPVIFGVLLALLVGHGTLRALGLLCLLALPLGARADLLDDIPECRYEDCELVNRPAKPIGLFLALLLAVLGGCGPVDPCPVEPQFWTDLGIGIYVEDGAAEATWTASPDLADRVDNIAALVASYSSTDVHSIAGWTIVFRGPERFYCDGVASIGCAHYSGWIEVKAVAFMDCVEQSSLPHEFLHALGFKGHDDNLWTDWVEVANAVTACDVSPDLWYP